MEIGSRKKWTTLALTAAAGLVLGLAVFLWFAPLFQCKNAQWREQRSKLAEAESLLSGKKEIESIWDRKRSVLTPSASGEAGLNLWLKELLNYSQAEGLVFDRIEPESAGSDKAETKVFLHFEGGIRKLIQFLYYLSEKDPLARVESFSVKREEESRNFGYELVLSKALL